MKRPVNKLDSIAARAAFARKLVEDSLGPAGKDPRDVLQPWDRENFLGADSVQLRIPLRDPVEVRQHLRLVEAAVRAVLVSLDPMTMGDRSALLLVQTAIKGLSKKINAYRVKKPSAADAT